MVFAVCLLSVTPVAATPGETTTGTTIGDQIPDSEDSSDDAPDDSSGEGADSGDSSTNDSNASTTDSTDDSGDASEETNDTSESSDTTSDASGDTDRDASTDGTSTTDSNGTAADSTEGTDGSLSTVTTNLASATDDLSSTTGVTDSVSEPHQLDSGSNAGTDATTPATLDAGTLGTTTVTSTTTAVTHDVVDAVGSGGLVDPATLVFTAIDTSSSPTRTHVDSSRLQSDAAARSLAATGATQLSLGGSSTGSTPLPPAPMTGLALGAGAIAATAAARNGALVPGALTNLGSALTAGLAPLAGRAGMFDRLVRMLAPFRYSRYDDSDPLEHDARADVYEVVNDAPGAYLSEVAEEAELPLSTARHHIRVLEREELVSGAKVRGKRRFYPAYTQGIELAAALNDEATAAVIDAVARFGAASVSDLATELERDPSTVSHHLKRLAEDDIIVRERDGRAVMNKLSAEARTALDPGTDSPAVEAGEAMASD